MFRIKTRALERRLEEIFPIGNSLFPGGISLHYPSGPLEVHLDTVHHEDTAEDSTTYYAWCQSFRDLSEDGHIDAGLYRIAEVIKTEGPFDGIVGFSQGAVAAGFATSLLEPGRKSAFDKGASCKGGMPYPSYFSKESSTESIQPPFKFFVSYSGIHAENQMYNAFYQPKIMTPIIQFIGKYDSFIEESACLQLLERSGGQKRLVYHPGSHFVPLQKEFVDNVASFILEILSEEKTAHDQNPALSVAMSKGTRSTVCLPERFSCRCHLQSSLKWRKQRQLYPAVVRMATVSTLSISAAGLLASDIAAVLRP